MRFLDSPGSSLRFSSAPGSKGPRQPLPTTAGLAALVSTLAFAGCSDESGAIGRTGGTSAAGDQDVIGRTDTGGAATGSGGRSSSGGARAGTGGDPGREPPPNTSFIELLSQNDFSAMFPITDPNSPLADEFAICPSECRSATTYQGLVDAAALFPEFAAVGSVEQRQREIIAFLANVAKETTGGWDDAPGGKEAWGLCYCEEIGASGYTQSSDPNYQAVPGESYHGRGPIQLSYPYNYGPFSEFVYDDKNVLLENPDLVVEDPELFWASGLWFWMSEDVAPEYDEPTGDPSGGGLDGIYYKPSCHMAMTETWIPRTSDEQKNRTFGFGVTINVINGGLECGGSWDARGQNRVAFYDEFASILGAAGVPTGWTSSDYQTCQNQVPFSTP